jgi:hypothetical protein
MGDRLKTAEAETVADALVLTEWKRVTDSGSSEKIATQALGQAQRYSRGSLAGFELAGYRYIVLVSEDFLPALPDEREGGVVYRHINIAVSPRTPGA